MDMTLAIYYSCILYLWLLIYDCRNMEMPVLTLKSHVWNDVFRIISITIIIFIDYQIITTKQKEWEKAELSTVFVWFKEGKNNCLILAALLNTLYWPLGRKIFAVAKAVNYHYLIAVQANIINWRLWKEPNSKTVTKVWLKRFWLSSEKMTVIQVRWLSYYRVMIIRQAIVGMSLIGRLCGYWLWENDIYKHQSVIS